MPRRPARALGFVADVIVKAAILIAIAVLVVAVLAWSLVVIPVALVAALTWKACRGARARLVERSGAAP